MQSGEDNQIGQLETVQVYKTTGGVNDEVAVGTNVQNYSPTGEYLNTFQTKKTDSGFGEFLAGAGLLFGGAALAGLGGGAGTVGTTGLTMGELAQLDLALGGAGGTAGATSLANALTTGATVGTLTNLTGGSGTGALTGGAGLLTTGGTTGGNATSSEGATVVDIYFEGSGKSRMKITVFSNGYIKRVSAPETDMDEQNDLEFQQGVETASSILAATLKYYGMDEPALLQDVKTALADRRITGASTIDDIGIQLRESEAFRRRFAANETRRAANKPAYSVSQYLQLESSYRQVLNAAGMPKDFYNNQEDFEAFITNDISPDEVQYRVQQGYAAVKNADPAVVNELKTLYGLDEGTLAAYFIDPTSTNPMAASASGCRLRCHGQSSVLHRFRLVRCTPLQEPDDP